MGYKKIQNNEPLVLGPEDWTPEEWITLCKLFDVSAENTEIIKVDFKEFEIFEKD